MNVTVLRAPLTFIVLSSHTNRFSCIHWTNYTIFLPRCGKNKKIDCILQKLTATTGSVFSSSFWAGKQPQQGRTFSYYALCILCSRYALPVSPTASAGAGCTLAVYQLICLDKFGYAPGLSDTSSRFMRGIAIKYL